MALISHIRRALPSAAAWSMDLSWLTAHFPEAIAEEIMASGSASMRAADGAQADDVAATIAHVCAVPQSACLLIAEVDQQRAGYFLGVIRENIGETPRFIGYVNGLYVLPTFRRGGIATLLARAGLDWFRTQHLPTVELYVALQNAAGKKFWEQFGFAPSAIILTAPLQ